jgi:hypothetical protein
LIKGKHQSFSLIFQSSQCIDVRHASSTSEDAAALSSPQYAFFPCAKVVISTLIMRRHIATCLLSKGTQTRHVSKEKSNHVASRWMLSCPSNLSWFSIAIRVTKFCTWGGYSTRHSKYISRLCANTMLCLAHLGYLTTSSLFCLQCAQTPCDAW